MTICENISDSNILGFMQGLSYQISCPSLSDAVSDSVSVGEPQKNVLIPWLHSTMYKHIKYKAWIFVMMMNWFLETQANRLSVLVNLHTATTYVVSQPDQNQTKPQPGAVPQLEAASQPEVIPQTDKTL